MSDTSALIMDEAHVICAPGKVTMSMNYVQAARSIILTISQRDDANGQKCGYQLEVSESSFDYDLESLVNEFNMFDSELLQDGFELITTPTEPSAPSSPRQPLTALRLGRLIRHRMEASSSDEESVQSLEKKAQLTENPQGSDHSSSKDPLSDVSFLNLADVNEKITAELLDKDRATGAYLLKLLEDDDFDKGLVDEFKLMINMVRHMNCMLFKDDSVATSKINSSTLTEVHGLAHEVGSYFNKLGNKLEDGLDAILDVKAYLPGLGPEVKPTYLRTALKHWNQQIMSKLACPQKCEKDLFDGFIAFYDAQIYHAFLQLRRENSEHDICRFANQFDTIQRKVERVSAAYDAIIGEMGKLGAAMRAAKKRLLSNLPLCHEIHEEHRQLKHLTLDLAEQLRMLKEDRDDAAGDPGDGTWTMSQYVQGITDRIALSRKKSDEDFLAAEAKKRKAKSKAKKKERQTQAAAADTVSSSTTTLLPETPKVKPEEDEDAKE